MHLGDELWSTWSTIFATHREAPWQVGIAAEHVKEDSHWDVPFEREAVVVKPDAVFSRWQEMLVMRVSAVFCVYWRT